MITLLQAVNFVTCGSSGSDRASEYNSLTATVIHNQFAERSAVQPDKGILGELVELACDMALLGYLFPLVGFI